MSNSDKEKIKEALLRRALGYEAEEKEIIVDKNKRDTNRAKVIKKHIPPDVTAIKYIQNLIDTERW